MKKILLTMLLMATMAFSYARPVYTYARIVATEKLASYEYSEINVHIGSKIMKFNTIDDAMSFLGKIGYELVSSHVSNKGRDAHHYFMFKRLESDVQEQTREAE